jgi:catechol 2,3-dioxygenase-like lactoylglutathione lyase family enzyme
LPRATANERPPIWIGHSVLRVNDVAKTAEFWAGLGLRPIHLDDRIAILELRGGTHLLVFPADRPVESGTPAPFDLMVDDIDAARVEFEAAGLKPSPMRTTPIHRSFTISDPSGYVIVFNSSHVGTQPV